MQAALLSVKLKIVSHSIDLSDDGMNAHEDILAEVHRVLDSEPDLGPEARRVLLSLDREAVLTIEGDVPSIAVKKKTLQRVAAVPVLNGIVDRLRVTPVVRADDRQVRSHLLRALEEEPALSGIDLHEKSHGMVTVTRQISDGRRGWIEVYVSDGVIRLDGEVPGLDYKRLAGLLAWWTPGARDVANGIAVEPAEEDGPDMIEDSVLLALRMDPSIDASLIRVGVRHTIVRLTGYVPTELQRSLAENDAWAIFGVDQVIDHLTVGRPRGHPILSSEQEALPSPNTEARPWWRINGRTLLAASCLAMLAGIIVLFVGWTSDFPTSYVLGLPLLLGGLLGFFIWYFFCGPFLDHLSHLT
jgi:osmotically-inducible protein OsmY